MDAPNTDIIKNSLAALQEVIHQNAINKGFWPEFDGLDTADENDMVDARSEINVGEKLALIHSEVSEALEAARKPIPEMDEHIPAASNFSVELSDVVIRCFDLAGAFGIPLGDIVLEKMKFNAGRPKKHGKRF